MLVTGENPFVIPQREPPRKDDLCTTRAITAWMRDLPTANIGSTAEKLFKQLKRMNRVEISPADRFRILESLQEVLRPVLNSLARHYAREQLPLSEKNYLTSELARELMTETVIGYKSVIKQYHESSQSLMGRLRHDRLRAEALHRMLHFLGHILLQAYQLYQDNPRYLWGEIHDVFRYATKQNLHLKREENVKEKPGEAPPTLSDLYKKILLLSLSGPHQLMKGEIEVVFKALSQWAPLSELIDIEDAEPESGLFVIYGKLDAPPTYRQWLGSPEGLKGWILDTRSLCQTLLEKLEAMQKKRMPSTVQPRSTSSSMSEDLLSRVIQAWGMGAKREMQRTHKPGHLRVAVGFDTLFGLFGGSALLQSGVTGREAPQEEREGEPGSAPFQIDKEEGDEIVDELYELDSVFSDDVTVDSGLSRLLTSEVRSELCEILDESPEGLRLQWLESGTFFPRVGELVAINDAFPLTPETWRLGIIRWLRNSVPGRLELGVEVVAEEVVAAVIRQMPGGLGRTRDWGGLLLLDKEGRGNDTLITPPFFPAPEDKLQLLLQDKQRRISLDRLLENTGSFLQFRFSPHGPQKPKSAPSKSKPEGARESSPPKELVEDPFASLWRSL